jgi:hypothetical protein
MSTSTTYYNLTASYATGLMKLYNSKNLADPNQETGYIKSGSKYISIGFGTLSSIQVECSSQSDTIQQFYIGGPAVGATTTEGLCSASYSMETPAWAYLPTPFTTSDIQNSNRTVYSDTGSASNTDPANFIKLSEEIVGSGTITRYWAISAAYPGLGSTTDDGTTWSTIQITNTDPNSYASSAASIDCDGGGGGIE